ncbi:MAG: NAD(P)/FAD-dependent oxidoreductase [Bacteroidetes bacterium]|nr:NAD(P)/FAD-dependent oxidoreductase [Bacteroidota bacterium]
MTEQNTYQIAIVGGGLAGLSLAIQMADAGYSCVLFEKNKYPFHKVCGEYISMESYDFIERLGLNLSEMNLPRINKLEVSSPKGKLLNHKLSLGGFGISRFLLDEKLAALAIEKGVTILEECKVNNILFPDEQFIIETGKGNYTASVCVGAWGKRSNMDKKLDRDFIKNASREKNYVGIKYHVKYNFPNDLIQLHNFKNGYCGISKVENDICCLCYLTDAENLKMHGGNIKKMETEILMQNPHLKKYFESAEFLFDEPATISQIKIGKKSAVDQHILMLGDTAGFIAPLSGNGMSMALRGSYMIHFLLIHFFEKKISRNDLEKGYTTMWNRNFKNKVVFSKSLQKLLSNVSLTNFAISILSKLPFLMQQVVKRTHGKPF